MRLRDTPQGASNEFLHKALLKLGLQRENVDYLLICASMVVIFFSARSVPHEGPRASGCISLLAASGCDKTDRPQNNRRRDGSRQTAHTVGI